MEPTVLKFANLELLEKAFEEATFADDGIDFHTDYLNDVEEFGENTLKMIDIAFETLKEKGYQPSMENYVVEYHHWKIDSDIEKPHSFGWHSDDDGHIDNSVAALFYLKKDPGLEGGNLVWGQEEKDEKEIIIEDGSLILIEGNIEHIPQPMKGKGERKLIVFFFHSDITH